MGKNNNIIEINGNRYDAHTGAVLSHSGNVPKAEAVAPLASKPSQHHKPYRQAARHHSAHAPKTAHTLMRTVVKKPGPQKHIKAQAPAGILAKRSQGEIVAKPSAKRLDPKRLQLAKRVGKSKLVTHFAPVTTDSFEPVAPVTPIVAPVIATPPAVHRGKNTKPKTTADILEHALRQATSHETAAPHKKTRATRKGRAKGIGGAAALAVLLLGVMVTQNMPSLKLQMASAKAGFDARLPDYKPAGYSLDQLNYGSGVVATSFASNSDDRAYNITQKPSTWDNTALRDSFVALQDKNYQSIGSDNLTIFIYGQSNATWVSDNIWYVVQSNGSLSARQLIDLATSL